MRERRPGLSVRIKLTLSFAAFLVLAGVAIFVVGFLLLRFVPSGNLVDAVTGGWAPSRGDLIAVFVRYSIYALAGLVVVGIGGGWLLAGLVLRPLARMTDTARRVREGAFSERIRLPGRRDELTDLADAFDGMLDRVEHTLEAERRFAANASHELRTPHAIVKTMVEVARQDPDRDVDTVLERIALTNDRAIATTEALLELARAERANEHEKTDIDLAVIAQDILDETDAHDVLVHTMLAAAPIRAHRVLVAQLVANLVRNAIVHNVPHGSMRVTTAMEPRGAVLTVENTGTALTEAQLATLTEPFVRGAGRVQGPHRGVGLGLAIVAAIVRAHYGALALESRTGGGLRVRVTLPG